MKSEGLDELFAATCSKHAGHPDVDSLNVDELVEQLRNARWILEDWKKSTSSWLPPLALSVEVGKFQNAFENFRGMTKVVNEYIVEFSKLPMADATALTSQKRHWRAERSKIADSLFDDRKIPHAIAKIAADVWYNDISAAKECEINLGYQDVHLWKDEPLTWHDPFVVPAEHKFEGTPGHIHTACWATYTRCSESADLRDAHTQCLNGMSAAKIRGARLATSMTDQFDWGLGGTAEATWVTDLKATLQVVSAENYDSSLRACPFRHVPGMHQVATGTFVVLILPPEFCLEHSNIQQYIAGAQSTAFSKHLTFLAGPGTSFYVPFGFTLIMFAVSDQYVHAILGTDPKVREEARKVKKPTEVTASFLVHPRFDAEMHSMAEESLRKVVIFIWHQAAAWLPRSWKSSAQVVAYFKLLAGIVEDEDSQAVESAEPFSRPGSIVV